MSKRSKNKNSIVIIDDDFYFRQILKSYINAALDTPKIYTSSNGVEGLGFVIATNPNVVIIDTTLPKYSGKKLTEFLISNPRFSETQFIIIHDGENDISFPPNYKITQKDSPTFLKDVLETTIKRLNAKKTFALPTVKIGSVALLIANKNNILQRKLSYLPRFSLRKVFPLIRLIIHYGLLSIVMTIVRVSVGKGRDKYTLQRDNDISEFRMRYYPTLATAFLPVLFIVAQVVLLAIGGVSIANLEMNSIFADEEGTRDYIPTTATSEDYDYSEEVVVFEENGVILQKDQIDQLDQGTNGLNGVDGIPEKIPLNQIDQLNQVDQSDNKAGSAQPTADSEPKTDSSEQATTPTYQYIIDQPAFIETKTGIPSTKILNLTEVVKTVDINGIIVDDITDQTEVRYQISTDRKTWWYVADDVWTHALATRGESNNLEELLKSIETLGESIEGQNIFFRIFLISNDENYSPKLQRLSVTYEKPTIHFGGGSSSFAAVDPTLSEYYVDGVGGDDNNAGTAAAPLQTIQAAADVADAGDTVYVKGGITYTEGITPANSGTSGNYITYTAWPGTGIPTIDGSDVLRIFDLSQDYIWINGFKLINNSLNVTGSNNNPLNIGSSNLIISNNILDIGAGNGIAMQTSDSVLIYNNVIKGFDYGIVAVSVSNITVSNNIIVDNTSFGIAEIVTTGITGDYNLYYNNTTNYSGVAPGANDITGQDPLFVDAAGDDFRLLGYSPAIDVGFDTTGTITDDIIGRPRSIEGGVDIGAYENITEYYVAGDTGSDSNYGTETSPYQTIQAAADEAVAANTIYVKGGVTYDDVDTCYFGLALAVVCIETAGTSGNPVTFTSWSGTGKPIIDASDANQGFLMHDLFTTVEYIVIDGFEIRDTGQNVTNAFGNRHGISIDHFVTVTNNLVINSKDVGIGTFLTTGLHDAYIYNNTVVGAELSGIHAPTLPSYTTYIQNNIVTDSNPGIYLNAAGTFNNTDYNVLHNNTSDYNAGSTGGSNTIFSDPLYTDSGNLDYTLQEYSPAINTGVDFSGTVDDDILGYNRPRGGAYDIGAYEDRNIYIADDVGNDTTGDGSATNPWKTINTGALIAAYGDTVHVKGGLTYTTSQSCWGGGNFGTVCPQNSGTANNYITYTNWEGTGIPTIDNGDTGDGFTFGGLDYIKINGFIFQNVVREVDMVNAQYMIVTNNVMNSKNANAYLNAHNLQFKNNTLTDAFVFIYGDNMEIKNNIFHGTWLDIVGTGLDSDYNLFNNVTFSSPYTLNTNDISDQDPQFVDEAGGDFRLMGNSPGIDGGVDVTATVTTDITEIPRFIENGVDIGAYENITNYYVADDTGDDTNLGIITEPFKTIQHAADEVLPGGTVHVKGNLTYATPTGGNTCIVGSGGDKAVVCIRNIGTTQNPLVFQAWEGTGIPTIDGGLASVDTGMTVALNTAEYVTLKGFRLLRGDNASVGNASGIRINLTTGIKIQNNIVDVRNTFSGIIDVNYSNDTEITNNTIYSDTLPFISSIRELGLSNFYSGLHITNNAIINVGGTGIWCHSQNPDMTIRNNLLYGADTDFQNCGGIDTGTILGKDPYALDISNGGFRLMGNSPAIDAGIDVTTDIPLDIAENPRLLEGGVDIGAYEHIVDYYVADDVGDDTNLGLISEPFKTIQTAADIALPGSTIHVKGGLTYNDKKTCFSGTGADSAVVCIASAISGASYSGTAENPIIYQQWEGTGVPIIDTGVNSGGGTSAGFNLLAVDYTEIHGFEIINVGSTGILNNLGGIRFFGADNGKAINNVMRDAAGDFTLGIYSIQSDNVEIVNNTIVDHRYGIAQYLTSDNVIANNLITHQNTGDGFLCISASNYTLSNNLLYGYENNYTGCTPGLTDILDQDPFFVNPGLDDYRLTKLSPAVEAGDDSQLGQVSKDILETIRPQRDHIDIGAYEFFDDTVAPVDIIRVGIVDVMPANEIEFNTPFYDVDVVGTGEANATVYFENKETGEIVTVVVDSNGDFELRLSNELGVNEYYYHQVDDWGNESMQRLLRIIVTEEEDEDGDEEEEITTTRETTLPDTGDQGTGSGEQEAEDNTAIQQFTARIVPLLPITGVVTLGFISLLAFGFSGSLSDFFLNTGFLIGIVYKRKKKYWGIVFDQQSNEPIPFAIIRLFQDGRLIKQTVADLEGRYALIAEEDGEYKLECKANGYQLYEKTISIKEAVDIVEDVPLLKINQKLNFLRRYFNHNRSDVIRFIKYGLVGLMVFGFLYTIYVTIQSPHIVNFILLGIYTLLLFLNALELLRYITQKSGKVVEVKTNDGVGGVSVRIYQAGKQIDVVLSNMKGIIKFNLKEGTYRFLAHKSGYEMASKERGRGMKLELSDTGQLSSSIKMKQFTKNKEQRASNNEPEADITPFGPN